MAKPDPHFSLLRSLLSLSIFLCLVPRGESSSWSGLEDDLTSWLNEEDSEVDVVQTRHDPSRGSCNFTSGKWVYDQTYPLYDSTCPYLGTAVTCQKNGRPDSEYQKLKWVPNGCSIPRFDALKFLGKMRRKRVMLVGDSIMRNQWESLVCLVQGVIPTGHKKVTYAGPSMSFHALDFEASIEFTWAPLLVELKKEPGSKRIFTWAPLLVELKKEPGSKRILHLDMIEDNARYWRNVDVLVFDSAHWWTHSDKRSSWDYYMEGNSMFKSMNPMVAYQKGLTTWAKWIDLNLDTRRTKVVFRTMSPRHNKENGWKCYNQRKPLAFFSHQHDPEPVAVLKEVLRRTSFPVYLQDITAMSALRRDGHPSVYSRALSQDKRQQHPAGHSSDCSHWCLPGVPDIWNEMLSALL